MQKSRRRQRRLDAPIHTQLSLGQTFNFCWKWTQAQREKLILEFLRNGKIFFSLDFDDLKKACYYYYYYCIILCVFRFISCFMSFLVAPF